MSRPQRFVSLSGFVLAGGAGRRMGWPKPLLMLGGETMLERQLRLLRTVCRTVAIVGGPGDFAGIDARVLPDELPGQGPLGGIYTGLRRARTEFGLFLGCDLPLMEARFLSFLARQALWESADATVPEAKDSRLQPLCAVYRRSALPAIRASLEAGELEIRSFFHRVRCRVVPWREVARAGFAPRVFANMNRPQDYESAKAAIGAC